MWGKMGTTRLQPSSVSLWKQLRPLLLSKRLNTCVNPKMDSFVMKVVLIRISLAYNIKLDMELNEETGQLASKLASSFEKWGRRNCSHLAVACGNKCFSFLTWNWTKKRSNLFPNWLLPFVQRSGWFDISDPGGLSLIGLLGRYIEVDS